MIITNKIKIKWNSKTKKYYEELGYVYTKIGDEFEIDIQHLKKYSRERIEVLCDYCNEIYHPTYQAYYQAQENNIKNNLFKDCCNNPQCIGKKSKEVLLLKYGVENARYIDGVNEKIKNTNLEKYGCENPFGNEEVKQKIYNTNIKKYGVKCVMQLPQYIELSKKIMLEKYGVESCGGHYSKTHIGENSPNWNPNIEHDENGRDNHEYNIWRKGVFERDDYTCKCCGMKRIYSYQPSLNAHHIKNFADNPNCRTDIDNGITLCEQCHKKFHNKYGKRNTNYEQLNEFLLDEKVC